MEIKKIWFIGFEKYVENYEMTIQLFKEELKAKDGSTYYGRVLAFKTLEECKDYIEKNTDSMAHDFIPISYTIVDGNEKNNQWVIQ